MDKGGNYGWCKQKVNIYQKIVNITKTRGPLSQPLLVDIIDVEIGLSQNTAKEYINRLIRVGKLARDINGLVIVKAPVIEEHVIS